MSTPWWTWQRDRCEGDLEEVFPDSGGSELYCQKCGWPDSAAMIPAGAPWSRLGPWSNSSNPIRHRGGVMNRLLELVEAAETGLADIKMRCAEIT